MFHLIANKLLKPLLLNTVLRRKWDSLDARRVKPGDMSTQWDLRDITHVFIAASSKEQPVLMCKKKEKICEILKPWRAALNTNSAASRTKGYGTESNQKEKNCTKTICNTMFHSLSALLSRPRG